MSEEILLKAEGIRQYFTVKKERGRKALLKAVDGVDLEIRQGETLGLVGESGCGKSTLGKAFLRLYPLTEGHIWFHGADVSVLKGRKLKEFRCKAQMIFQDPSSCLNPRRRIGEILEEPYVIHGFCARDERQRKIRELCDMVGLSNAYLERYPHEMSGGQKQRVGIARALALQPEFIVCDEPVSALDVSIQAQVLNLLQDLQVRLNLSYLFISHNLSVVRHCCQRIGVMYLGRLVELAPAERIYGHAIHPYTQALISAIPLIEEAKSEDGRRPRRKLLSGDLPSPMDPPSGCAFHTRCPFAEERCRQEMPALARMEPGHFAACHFPERAAQDWNTQV